MLNSLSPLSLSMVTHIFPFFSLHTPTHPPTHTHSHTPTHTHLCSSLSLPPSLLLHPNVFCVSTLYEMKLEWNVRGENEECFLAAKGGKKCFKKIRNKSILQILQKKRNIPGQDLKSFQTIQLRRFLFKIVFKICKILGNQ